MYTRKGILYRLTANHNSKVYIIRKYVDGKCMEKYRSEPMGKQFRDGWDSDSIQAFLETHTSILTRYK